MSPNRLPPPPAGCLCRPYPSNQKGGTLIADDVADLEAHRRRVCDPDCYRPGSCPGCGHGTLHVHDYPERGLREEPDGSPSVVLVRYRCILCRAVWRILPGFLARLLWRSWPVVEAVTLGPAPSPAAAQVPQRTVQRWRGRLAAAAVRIIEALREQGDALRVAVAGCSPTMATRLEVVEALAEALRIAPGQRLAQVAAAVHRQTPGVRLM